MKILNQIRGDFLGGIVSSIVALPQALAFGVATGLGAGAGVWSAIILCFIAGILGGTLVSGPTGPVTIILTSMILTNSFGLQMIVTVMALAAVFQFFIGLTPLPGIVKYVPYPVISGFMNGVGVLLILLQLNPLVGQPIEASPIESLKKLFTSSVNHDALILGGLTLLIVFLIPKKINRFFPSQIIALILGTIISIKMGADVARISEISFNFPKFILPELNPKVIFDCIPFALVLAVIASSESLLTGLVVDSLTKTKTPPKRLLTAQGIGNFFCAITGSLFGSAATMRSAAAINAGASTRLVTIINPLILLAVLICFSDFAKQIPLCVLAGILIKIGYDIIDTKLLKVIKYAPRDDLYVLAVVFLLTVFYNLIFAVGAGITLASLLYAKRVADKTSLGVKTVQDDEIDKLEKQLFKVYNYQIRVVHIDGQFFFGSATQLVAQFEEQLGTKFLLLNYESGALLDISAIFALEDIIIRLQGQKIRVLLIVKNEEVRGQLKDLNIISQVGDENVFYNEYDAVEEAKKQIKNKFLNKEQG